MSGKITTNQLTPQATFRITGRTEFGRIAKRVEGAELQKENENRQRKGWTTIDAPHTRLTIYDAQVIPNSGNMAQLTLEEQYALERMFLSQAHGQSPCFTGMNKGNSLPWVYYQPDPNAPATPVNLERELASGLLCTIYLSVYKPKGAGKNNGVSLDGIILHDAPVYFAGGNDSGASVLNRYGINIDPNAAPIAPPPANYEDPDALGQANDTGYAAPPQGQFAQPPAPAQQMAPPPTGYHAQPPYQAPAPAQQQFAQPPAPAGYPAQQQYQAPAPAAPYNQPPAPQTPGVPPAQAGIRFDPNAQQG
jgi:hypothetical protein